ncbi:MAG: sulfatase [Acidobacteriota bacterium]|jgi:arylsulfatase
MIRLRLLVPAALLLAACGARAPRPNVLLITVDTLRADRLGCYGYARATSPNIDRLAARGVLFERAFTTLPRTTQSVASIMTGRYPKAHGARGLFSSLSSANLTLAEILKEDGYDTAAFVSNLFLRPGQGFEQGFDRYDNPQRRWEGNSAAEITEAAIAWLRSRPADRPFFLWVHYLDPHWTYRPSAPFDRLFDPDFTGPFTLYDDLEGKRLTKGQVIFENRLPPRQVEHVAALYDGEIAQADAALGALLDALERPEGRPLLAVFTSDHGESLGEHDYHFAHGEYLYQESLRIPLILALPGGVAAGSRPDALAENVDIAPTILALVGISRMQGVDGRPLLISGRTAGPGTAGGFSPAPGRRVVLAESDFQLIHPENPRFYIQGPAGKWSSAFDGRYKLIHIPKPGGEILELYDLLHDPAETRNLAPDGAGPAVRLRLLGELQRFVDYGTGNPAGPHEMDPEQRQRLRALGYLN